MNSLIYPHVTWYITWTQILWRLSAVAKLVEYLHTISPLSPYHLALLWDVHVGVFGSVESTAILPISPHQCPDPCLKCPKLFGQFRGGFQQSRNCRQNCQYLHINAWILAWISKKYSDTSVEVSSSRKTAANTANISTQASHFFQTISDHFTEFAWMFSALLKFKILSPISPRSCPVLSHSTPSVQQTFCGGFQRQYNPTQCC